MVFNSMAFAIFFILFFLLFWFVFNRNLKAQNLLLLAGSYIFYAWWDWRFLSLLIGSSFINYYIGIQISKTTDEKRKGWLLLAGIFVGLAFLLFFKYYNFFIHSLIESLALFHITAHLSLLHLILPLGISFYTFRTISYLLDIYNEDIEPTRDIVVFFAYVAFFPSLLCGPIDRAGLLIPQLEKPRVFVSSNAIDGLRQILWGLFKKIVIANSCAIITDDIFANYQHLPASTLLFGAFFYLIQMYTDFSGYSDMAIGFSRLIGFSITKNFNYPFFAQNIADFWQRWHISLTSWMTDYVFTPLSFIYRRFRKKGLVLAIVINFLLVGLWHGANWTYIAFGLLQGCYFIPLILSGTLNNKKNESADAAFPGFKSLLKMTATFSLMMLTTVLLRSATISSAFNYYKSMLSASIFSKPVFGANNEPVLTVIFIAAMFIIEWNGRNEHYGIANLGLKWPRALRWSFYYLLIILLLIYTGEEQQFIYFNF